LRSGHTLEGPAIIAEYSATTWLPPRWAAEVAESGDLLLGPIGGGRAAR
jgi:N-methylhydantoinase A/oxoprolinase/acetone carboxylase beta subunit